jgi:hypothetical protein
VSDLFCFNGLGFTPKQAQATVSFLGGGANTVIHTGVPPSDSGVCPGAEQAHARMVDGATSTGETAHDFFIALYD